MMNGLWAQGCSAIMWASSAGRVDVLRWLLVHGLEFGKINAHGQGCVNKAAVSSQAVCRCV